MYVTDLAELRNYKIFNIFMLLIFFSVASHYWFYFFLSKTAVIFSGFGVFFSLLREYLKAWHYVRQIKVMSRFEDMSELVAY